jgi:hypothetical protein
MSRYVGTSAVSNAHIRAVTLLMGCASVAVAAGDAHPLFDARSVNDEYSIACWYAR